MYLYSTCMRIFNLDRTNSLRLIRLWLHTNTFDKTLQTNVSRAKFEWVNFDLSKWKEITFFCLTLRKLNFVPPYSIYMYKCFTLSDHEKKITFRCKRLLKGFAFIWREPAGPAECRSVWTQVCVGSVFQVELSFILSQAEATLSSLVQRGQELATRLRALQVDRKEIACFKFLLLFNPSESAFFSTCSPTILWMQAMKKKIKKKIKFWIKSVSCCV